MKLLIKLLIKLLMKLLMKSQIGSKSERVSDSIDSPLALGCALTHLSGLVEVANSGEP